jgi:hypothetical protein
MFYGKEYQTVEAENNRRLNPPEEIDCSETEKDLTELINEADNERYELVVKKIKETVSSFEISYLLECIWDKMKLDDYNNFEKELRIILGDCRLKNY